MKPWIPLLPLVLTGCVNIGALAPDYAIGTYRGAVLGRGGLCAAPAGELTVNIAKSATYGDWYFEQPNARAQFGLGWVYDVGFFSSHVVGPARVDYVGGYFTQGGTALDARIDTGTCIYNGILLRT